MDWLAVRAQARQTVHDAFSYAATYTFINGDPQQVIKARLHREGGSIGDPGQDGYADRIISMPKIVIHEDTGISPTRGDILEFADGVRVEVDNVLPPTPPVIVCEVAEL